MTRIEIERDYRIQQGIITSPGKFQGEPVWAPHFYELWLEGAARYEEDEEHQRALIPITDEDRAEFPELDPTSTEIRLYESEQGFVHTAEI